jgi:diadenosine tetraphosphatase ApaH/serine/threonine PP2A family protein phosphatase
MPRRVAALYDVHGNLPALDAVLEEVSADTDIILVGGDVAAGPWPAETLERLRGLGDRVRWISGNAVRELATPSEPTGDEEGGPPQQAITWTRDRLSQDQLAFLGGLPLTASIEVEGAGRVLFCHATPRSDDELLTGISEEGRWRAAIGGVDADVVVCGHTHVQFDRRIGDVRLVNAGSVGMPYEAEPGAYWLTIEADVEHRRTAYDTDRTAEEIAAIWPGEWPSASPAEATEYFERISRERG